MAIVIRILLRKGEKLLKCTNDANKMNKNLIFKNNAPFRSCISKFADNAEDLDIVMPMCNLLEFSGNYSMTSRSFCNYYRDEMNDAANEIVANRRLNNNKITRLGIRQSKSLGTRQKIGRTPANNNTLDTQVVIT